MKRKIALLLALVMVLSFVPMMSFAASTVTASVPAVAKAPNQTLGNVTMTLSAGSITKGQSFFLDLNNDVVLPAFDASVGAVSGRVYAASTSSDFGLYLDGGQFVGNPAANQVAYMTRVGDRRVQVTFNENVKIGETASVVFTLGKMDTSKSSNGAIEATVVAAPGSPFTAGKVQVAVVGDSKDVVLETGSLKESNNNFTFNLKVKEDNPGAIQSGSTIRLELPAGFEWNTASGTASLPITSTGTTGPWYYEQYGTNMKDDIEFIRVSDSVLEIKFTATTSAVTSFEIRRLSFSVEDSSKVKEGDIVAKVRTTGIRRNTSDLKVGTYGEYGVRVVVEDDLPTIFSGQIGQEVVTMIVKETISNSLIAGRDVEFILPSYAKWTDASGTYSDENLRAKVKTDLTESNPNRTLRLEIEANGSGDPATIELEEYEVAVEPGFTGDLVVEVRGAGMDAHEVVIAKVIEPVVMESKNAPTVIIGRADQQIGDIVITESAEEAFLRDGRVSLVLPQGVRFTKAPVVKVTDGDLVIENVSTTSNSDRVTFDVDRQSYKASKITISNVYITVDRTVPEGNITAELTGDGIIDTNVEVRTGGVVVIDAKDYWPNSHTAAEVVVAKVGTPAPGEVGRDAVSLTIGQIPAGGDAAPYISNSRTYAPVSAVAQSLGINKNNIIWNEATRTVTILGDVTVQMTIGSSTLLVNGTPLTMDVAPEITSSRTFLPIAWLAKALNVEYTWDAATQTVTFY